MTDESVEIRRKRLKMRSIRRGIREMDLILTAFCEAELERMSRGELDIYEALLSENDHDLYAWVSGTAAAPDSYREMIGSIAAMARGVTRPA